MRKRAGNEMPFIDPAVEHVGVSRLRQLDGKSLKENVENKALVIRDHDTPLAVLVSYEKYLSIQNQMDAVMETLEILSNQDEMRMLVESLQAVAAGKTRSLSEIRDSLDHSPE